MSNQLNMVLTELDRLKCRVAELEALQGVSARPAPVASSNDPWARLIVLARQDPAAAKAEAKRLNRLDSIQRKEARRQSCGDNIVAP